MLNLATLLARTINLLLGNHFRGGQVISAWLYKFIFLQLGLCLHLLMESPAPSLYTRPPLRVAWLGVAISGFRRIRGGLVQWITPLPSMLRTISTRNRSTLESQQRR